MNLLIIAFDGMDKELIEKYDLENIPMQEYGTFDNTTGMKTRKTVELFTCFITGETHEEHGVTGVWRKSYSPFLERLESLFENTFIGMKTRELRHAIYDAVHRIDYSKRRYSKFDFDQETIFEKTGGKALFVPPVDTELDWSISSPGKALEQGFTSEEVNERAEELTDRRINRFDELSTDFWKMIMFHIHQPDWSQHFRTTIEDTYKRLDEFAGGIQKEYPDTKIIFMSDHGRPGTEMGHNEKCFYSANFELFPEKEPHITEFYEEIQKHV